MASRTVRVFLGTRKGSFVAESDAKRRKWTIRGPYQSGTDVYHVAADPRHEGSIYAAGNNSFWGPSLYKSTDHGKKWKEIATPTLPPRSERQPPEDPLNPPKRAVQALWHVEPGLETEPDTVYMGVDPGGLYRSEDLGKSWEPVSGLNDHPTRPKWNPGAGGMCTHTVLLDPRRKGRMYVGISAAGTFRSDNGGKSWRPMNKGVEVSFQPEKFPEVGQCVHHVTLDSASPETLYRQDHDGIYISRDGMESWQHIGKPLGDDFGFVVTSPAARPGTAYFVPLQGMARTTGKDGIRVLRWSESNRKFRDTFPGKKFAGTFGTHREGLASDSLDPPGLYLGTTTGDLFVSPDETKSWQLLPYRFPAIHSVSVAVSGPRR
jgi:hypothetical protein